MALHPSGEGRPDRLALALTTKHRLLQIPRTPSKARVQSRGTVGQVLRIHNQPRTRVVSLGRSPGGPRFRHGNPEIPELGRAQGGAGSVRRWWGRVRSASDSSPGTLKTLRPSGLSQSRLRTCTSTASRTNPSHTPSHISAHRQQDTGSERYARDLLSSVQLSSVVPWHSFDHTRNAQVVGSSPTSGSRSAGQMARLQSEVRRAGILSRQFTSSQVVESSPCGMRPQWPHDRLDAERIS